MAFCCYHKLNCHPFLLGSVHKKRRSNLSVAVQFSSAVVQIDNGNSLPQSNKISGSGIAPKEYEKPNSLLKQENAVGIIGGVSVLSTLIFLEKLVWMSSRDGEETIPFVVCSDPSITRDLQLHTCCHSLSSRNAKLKLNTETIIESLKCKRKFLDQSGARCIVMPCHLSHTWYDEISEGCLLPFFHVGDCVASELKAAKLKPLEAGSDVRIGILSPDATLTAGFYLEKLQNQGFEVVLPDKGTTDHILIPAIEALRRRDIEGAQNLLRIAIHILLMRAVNIVILASDELQGLLPPNDPLQKKCIDPMDALARSIIKWAKPKG